jgi:hypothetical protein
VVAVCSVTFLMDSLERVTALGRAYSQSADPGKPQNFWWRKNRRVADMPGGAVGVDVKPQLRLPLVQRHRHGTDATQDIYRGPAAFSESETRDLRSVLDAHDGIGYFVDVHSFGELILYSWGDDEDQGDVPEQNFLNPACDGVRGVVGDGVYREFVDVDDRATVVALASAMNAALRQVRERSCSVDLWGSTHLGDVGRLLLQSASCRPGPRQDPRLCHRVRAAVRTPLCRDAEGHGGRGHRPHRVGPPLGGRGAAAHRSSARAGRSAP